MRKRNKAACVWARESTAPAQGIQSLSRELRASALAGLEERRRCRATARITTRRKSTEIKAKATTR